MKRMFFVIAFMILFICFSVVAFAQTNDEHDIDSVTDYENELESVNKDFLVICEQVFKSSQTIISAVCTLLFGGYLWFFKKEIPKKWSIIIPAILLLIITIARLLLRLKYSDFSITLLLIIVLIFSFISLIRTQEKNNNLSNKINNAVNIPEKKALNAIKRLVNKSHTAIECIQLYSLDEFIGEKNVEYHINLIGGHSKKNVNINALFSFVITIPREYVDSLLAILKAYSQFSSDNDFSQEEQNALSILISNEIVKLKNVLNQIPSADKITETDCYLARMLLIYISLYATIERHDTYIGLGRDSLSLNNPELEYALLTSERTGVLGAILLNNLPYVFSYRGNHKIGRFYYTFSCDTTPKYIAMISMKNRNNEYYIDYHMSNNIKKIEKRLTDILNSNNTKFSKGGENNER